jgi:hypothetical protein
MVIGWRNKVLLTSLFVFIGFCHAAFAVTNGGFVNVKKAFDKGLVDVEMVSLGCYNSDCLTMFITNKTDKTLLLEIDAGQMLDPFDPSFQPYLIKNRQKLALPAGVSKELIIAVFCANMKKQVPDSEQYFAFADSTPNPWYQLTNYLAINDFEVELAQKAVWSVTNQFPMNAVCSANKKETNRIRLYLQSILPYEDQGMNLFFKTDSLGIPTNELASIRLEVPYSVRNNTMVSFYITNQRGEMVKKLKQGIPRNPGSYTYEVEFPVIGWRPGEYFVVVRSPEQLLLKKAFKIESF